ncbi:oral-facial-digital syndrome 1 protein isoform X1 [Xenopus laevis]|uniref:Oral-facial-digital syndrome 1 protein isoform X1 n=1 Tax=Xenopus laevis TaxID=8355 RepID=A0A8J0UFL9_XENLA|nr:oral-facial-digital syndrome 1 protein isoform X1 [Xenopus laevis]
MSSADFKSLSQEELRKRLYQTFKNKGVLDSLKTQLRNQLIHELKHPAFNGEPGHYLEALESDSLLHRASNSMVADHLRKCGYEYSLSVFYPECGLEKEKMFTVHDFLQLLKINPKSRLYKSLTSSARNESAKGFFFQLLMELTDYHLHREGRDADTQTVTTSPYKDSIVEKLKFIDEQFEEIYPKRKNFESLESKLSDYRREMEEQLRTEMAQKLQHFKDVEIAKIKLDETEKSQREMSDFRRELEKTYQAKLEGLVSREKNAIERLQRQQEIEAKEIYTQRQSLLKDIDSVRARESDLRQRMEALERTQKLEAEKNRSIDELLRKRELEVKNIEDTFDQKLKNELLRHQIELNEEYIKRTKKVSEDERRNKEEASRLREEAIAHNMKKHESEQAMSHIKELEIEVDSLKAQMSLVTRQNHHLTDKLKETIDYPLVHEEKLKLQGEVKLLKQQLDEIHKENQLLREKNIHPSAEYVVLQVELKRMESARKLEQEEFKTKKEILEKQLHNEIERCAEMKARLLNSEDSAKKCNSRVDRLELQLRQAQLENEVYRNPKPSLVDRSVLDFTADKIVPPDIYVDEAVLKSHCSYDTFAGAGGRSSPMYCHATRTRSSSPDSDFEFVANTKARIKELEKEAEFLEEAYRKYQNRISQAGSIETRPLSTVMMSYPDTVESSPLSTVPKTRRPVKILSDVPRQKVAFLEDDLTPEQHSLLSRLKSSHKEENPSETDITPPRTKISSARRLSSTPIPKRDQNSSEKQKILTEADHEDSILSSSQQSPKQLLSPIPNNGHISSINCDVPDIPVDTDKDPSNRPCEQDVNCDEVSNHLNPQKLYFDDLNSTNSSLQDQEDIPEQLATDLSHPSGDVVHDNHVIANVPVAVTSPVDSLSSQHSPENINKHEKTDEGGEQKDEEQFRELSEEEKDLHKNSMVNTTSNEGRENTEEIAGVQDREEASSSVQGSVNPLDKYMQMILQNRAQEQSEKVNKESLEDASVVEKVSNESITALSHGEDDENFW